MLRFITVVALCWVFIPLGSSRAQTNRPNVILMLADDMGMGDTSVYQDFTGNSDDVQLETPQMERLARMGIRLTDAHTPSSRCSPTRYGLLTGRYPWRNRLKHWVLFGTQGDPMIEADRPTIASMLRDAGYATAMVGKWHVGLRYQRSDALPAAGWNDADLTQPLFTSPTHHGFDFARFTSRSHGTSGPDAGAKTNIKGKDVKRKKTGGKNAKEKNAKKLNGPNQSVGPGHIHGRIAVGATGNGKQLVAEGANAYVLKKLGSRHSNHAIEFLEHHIQTADRQLKPFFLYYASNSNHGPYTPDESIGGQPVAGAARTKSGEPMDARHDFIYENDVALGRLLDWLEASNDPRNPGRKLIETTLVIFTSDNGAEKNSDIATGPFRSHKGSVYEGGHRVPFIASWAAGGIGNGDATTKGLTNDAPIGLQDLYATLVEILDGNLPDARAGKKGAEDSYSILAALRGHPLPNRPPLFFNDHKEATRDHAAMAIRIDSPMVNGKVYDGKWKLFFDASLIRAGEAAPYELYDLAVDQWETNDLIDSPKLQPLIQHMTDQALTHRRVGGHRIAQFAPSHRVVLDMRSQSDLAAKLAGKSSSEIRIERPEGDLKITIKAFASDRRTEAPLFTCDSVGMGISGGNSRSVDDREALLIQFDRDVIVESAAIVSEKEGQCGGYYQVGNGSPLAIYCVNADIDAQDQSGILSDIGVLKAGQTLRLDSSPLYDVEDPGNWRLATLSVRVID